MINYKNVEISDKEWVDPLLAAANVRGCHYSFTNLFAWTGIYKYRIAQVEEYLVVKAVDWFLIGLIVANVGAVVLESIEHLSIAHGMSRAALDAHHSGCARDVSVGLLHEDELKSLMAA